MSHVSTIAEPVDVVDLISAGSDRSIAPFHRVLVRDSPVSPGGGADPLPLLSSGEDLLARAAPLQTHFRAARFFSVYCILSTCLRGCTVFVNLPAAVPFEF